MPVIRHEAIAQNTHKNFGLSFCQDFFERGIVSVISENPIPGIPTIESVKKHSPQRLTCCFWHTDQNIPRKLPLSTMIWPHPVASTRPQCVCSPDCVTWGYQGHPQGNCAEHQFLKNRKKKVDKQKLCFYDFLRDVFAARFSGERRTGVRCLLGISRSQISGGKSSGSGTRAAGPPITRFFPNDWVFSKTGCRCL